MIDTLRLKTSIKIVMERELALVHMEMMLQTKRYVGLLLKTINYAYLIGSFRCGLVDLSVHEGQHLGLPEGKFDVALVVNFDLHFPKDLSSPRSVNAAILRYSLQHRVRARVQQLQGRVQHVVTKLMYSVGVLTVNTESYNAESYNAGLSLVL